MNGKKLGFYKIPRENRDLPRRNEWLAAISREDWEPHVESVVCGVHFLTGKPHNDRRHPDYRPQIFKYKEVDLEKLQRDLNRYERNMARCFQKVEVEKRDDAVNALLALNSFLENIEETQDKNNNLVNDSNFIYTATPLTMLSDSAELNDIKTKFESLKTELKNVKAELVLIKEENIHLKSELQTIRNQYKKLSDDYQYVNQQLYKSRNKCEALTFGSQQIRSDDKKCNFYTGLPKFALFIMVFNLISKDVKKSRTELSLMDEFFLFLIRLRLNLSFEDLAYRSLVSISTVSRLFYKWLNICFGRLRFLINWPSREAVRNTLPNMFREHFPHTVCIIDCTEIFIEKPKKLISRSQTFSPYKKHNTAKVLLAISPTGSFCFISKAWGGKVSDKEIVKESGFLENLSPGDQVLADRGFVNDEDFALRGAKLTIPSFTKGKNQLSASDIERSRNLSRVRIEVERLIGYLKSKYTILEGPLPIHLCTKKGDSEYAIVDKIVAVCGSLTNLCETIVDVNKI